ncbi:MAG: DUF4260 domain-containing protein [Shimia sp.]
MTAIHWQRLEGAAVFAAIVGALSWAGMPLPLWAAVLVFFAPDLSFVGYAAGPRVGAAAYNLCHTYGLPACLAVVGLPLDAPLAVALGLLWVGHAGFDRALGYGLKEAAGFKHTHLGHL